MNSFSVDRYNVIAQFHMTCYYLLNNCVEKTFM